MKYVCESVNIGTRSVHRVVVAAVDGELRPLPGGHLPDEGHQVGEGARGVLAHQAGRMGPDRVEVAQGDDVPLLQTHTRQGMLKMNSNKKFRK